MWEPKAPLKPQVMFLQNGTAAFFVSTSGAFIAMVLVAVGILPPYQAPDDSVFAGVSWCTSCGLVLYCLTILFWRRRFSIFLDVICIDQEDERRKMMGILSMGASLKSSESMLVLWDSSYVHRLWCVWEPLMNMAEFTRRIVHLWMQFWENEYTLISGPTTKSRVLLCRCKSKKRKHVVSLNLPFV